MSKKQESQVQVQTGTKVSMSVLTSLMVGGIAIVTSFGFSAAYSLFSSTNSSSYTYTNSSTNLNSVNYNANTALTTQGDSGDTTQAGGTTVSASDDGCGCCDFGDNPKRNRRTGEVWHCANTNNKSACESLGGTCDGTKVCVNHESCENPASSSPTPTPTPVAVTSASATPSQSDCCCDLSGIETWLLACSQTSASNCSERGGTCIAGAQCMVDDKNATEDDPNGGKRGIRCRPTGTTSPDPILITSRNCEEFGPFSDTNSEHQVTTSCVQGADSSLCLSAESGLPDLPPGADLGCISPCQLYKKVSNSGSQCSTDIIEEIGMGPVLCLPVPAAAIVYAIANICINEVEDCTATVEAQCARSDPGDGWELVDPQPGAADAGAADAGGVQ